MKERPKLIADPQLSSKSQHKRKYIPKEKNLPSVPDHTSDRRKILLGGEGGPPQSLAPNHGERPREEAWKGALMNSARIS